MVLVTFTNQHQGLLLVYLDGTTFLNFGLNSVIHDTLSDFPFLKKVLIINWTFHLTAQDYSSESLLHLHELVGCLSVSAYLCKAENSLLSVRDMIQKDIWIQISMWHFCENFTMTSCFNWICFLEGMRQNGGSTVMLWLALLPHRNSQATVSVQTLHARVGYLRVLQLYPTV